MTLFVFQNTSRDNLFLRVNNHPQSRGDYLPLKPMNTRKFDNTQISAGYEQKLKEVAAFDTTTCLKNANSSDEGLSDSTVLQLRMQYGYNQIMHEKLPSWVMQLVHAFINPFNGILSLIIVISVSVNLFFSKPEDRDYNTIYVVLAMILLSSLLKFFQEYASNNAAKKLNEMIKTQASVIRKNTGKQEIDIKELVPGDIVTLSAGDMIPADCRVIHSKDLFISQSILTGESMPVEKSEQAETNTSKKSAFDLNNICFMGTNVLSGSATVLVICTGNSTYLGSINREISATEVETSFDKGVNSVSWLLVKFMMVMVPLVFLVNILTKGHWLDALLFSIAVAVGLTPEMLPMIVTANLARGAVRMSKKKVIIKRINAIQNFGAMDVLCTDKTGTLTLDQIVLEQYLNIHGAEDKEVLKWAFLNSYYQTGLKNLMDMAVLDHKEWEDHLDVQNEYQKIDEIPFDFERRRMSVVLERPSGDQILITKGAVEEMLALCNFVIEPGEHSNADLDQCKIEPINNEIQKNISDLSSKMNEQGLRVLIIAVKKFAKREATYSVNDERDMTLAGFIGFLDPAKPSAKPSIDALKEMGIQIKVLTGDNAIVCKKICGDVDIPVTNVITGIEMDAMDDNVLAAKVDETDIFAKLSPAQKIRIIRSLQSKGHTVGYMGDGINDAGALKNADVGISVDKAVDIAKESADIILLEKDLMVLAQGVMYGRQTFGNIIKYIKMTASSNFGNMFSMLGASVLLPFLPMLPIQLLFQNLLYDFSQSSIPWDVMDEEYLKQPRKWEADGIARFMFFIGPISSIFDYATFGVMYFIFKASAPEHQSLFQSGWFVEGLLSQTLIVHMIRTRKIPFIQSTASLPVIITTVAIMVIGVYIPFSPVAATMHFQPLPVAYFKWLAILLISYCLLTQMVKVWFIRKFKQWL
jgi:Mg2+-importing ATPase